MATGVVRDGAPIVQQLIAGLDNQQIALRSYARHFKRGELRDVLGREFEGFAGMEIGLGADKRTRRD